MVGGSTVPAPREGRDTRAVAGDASECGHHGRTGWCSTVILPDFRAGRQTRGRAVSPCACAGPVQGRGGDIQSVPVKSSPVYVVGDYENDRVFDLVEGRGLPDPR